MTVTTEMLDLAELCQATFVSSEVVIEIVEQGIIEPSGESPPDWRFDAQMVTVIRKATRLRQDLGVNWAGIALVMDLLEQVEQLRVENRLLSRRLHRFLMEDET